MNRLEQLTFDFLDGVLDPQGQMELDRLLAADPAGEQEFVALCRQEAALRSRPRALDVSAAVLGRLPVAASRSSVGASLPPASPAYPVGRNGESRERTIGLIPPPPPPPGSAAARRVEPPMALAPPLPPPPLPPMAAPPAREMASPPPRIPPTVAPPAREMASPPPAWAAAMALPAVPAAPVALPLLADGAADEGEAESVWSRRNVMAYLASMIVHLAAMILLALWAVPAASQSSARIAIQATSFREQEEAQPEFDTVVLDQELTPGSATAAADASGPPGSMSDAGLLGLEPLADLPATPSVAERLASSAPEPGHLLDTVPTSGRGSGLVVAEGYDHALDRITQEILGMLAKRSVLLVWCFDQSESMKPDQREIRGRIDRVYAELAATGKTSNRALATAVSSFGIGFTLHTPMPVFDVDEIRRAIDAVPVDPSGEEMMCSAVSQSIVAMRDFARRTNRQMAMILVTDESGNREETDRYLEPTVEQAMAARCRIYVLGREAVFGCPTAQARWVQPETGEVHLLPVDRGPESALFEQLQTEGFELRTDVLRSGFGPYAQSRLAAQTGGIFFMLPGQESIVLAGGPEHYAPERMRAYQPELGSRLDVLGECRRHPLRALVVKIVDDLNPNRPDVAKWMKMPERFPSDAAEFRRQVGETESRLALYQAGLKRADDALEALRTKRDAEPSARWRANYDLLRAQVADYGARVHLFYNALAQASAKLMGTPATEGDKRLVAWRIRQAPKIPLDSSATAALERARKLYLEVIRNHYGTPWASRAEWELARDFGYRGEQTADLGHHLAWDDAATAPTRRPARPAAGDLAGGPASAQVGVDVGIAVGGGAGGGGGGGGGGGIDVDAAPVGWGVDHYPGIELAPVYRAPPAARPAGGGHHRPAPSGPPPVRTPVPKL